MDEWIDKTVLLLFGFLIIFQNTHSYEPVVAFLIAVMAAALGTYLEDTKPKYLLFAAILPVACLFPLELFFFPVFLYDMIDVVKWRKNNTKNSAVRYIPFAAAAILLFLFFWNWPEDAVTGGFWAVTVLLAVALVFKTGKKRLLAEQLIHIRDSSVELNRMLEEKNRHLLEKQDYEIHLATLRERNRIAREIHDHVGHMLSRSLLLTGALLTTEKEGAVHDQLLLIRETLDAAMDNIRRSVHDLHEDSIDLKHSLEELLEPMKQDYAAKLDYDMSEGVPRQVKYALIAIAKEAVSNTIKHSNASRILLRCREHPGFYQFSAEDDGRSGQMPAGGGLGLQNMKERVDALGGTLHIHTEKGFCVFVIIPKTEEMRCG